jgi:hypothetical protein
MTEQMKNKIKALAKKAADYWNSLTLAQQDEYHDNGTMTVFEDVDMPAYMTILRADYDSYELSDMLEEEFWSIARDAKE